MIYHVCPRCGAHLDPGERCDCENRGKEKAPDGMAVPVERKCNTSMDILACRKGFVKYD